MPRGITMLGEKYVLKVGERYAQSLAPVICSCYCICTTNSELAMVEYCQSFNGGLFEFRLCCGECDDICPADPLGVLQTLPNP